MSDLEMAKRILKERNVSLVIVKEGRSLFESSSSGISGLLQAIRDQNKSLCRSSVADRVVGRAAGLLLAYSRVKAVYAATLSEEGLKVLNENHILVEHDELVNEILDREGRDVCPFERFSATITSLDEAYEQLEAFTKSLGKDR